MQTDNLVTQRETAKTALKTALTNHYGNTKHSAVVDAIALLSSLNPTPNPAEHQALLEGNWLLISAPNFPGRLEDKSHRFVYTLGRLAFNKFEPVDLRIALERVSQPVFATEKENEYSHDIVVEFKIIDENYPELHGIVKNLAVCSPVDADTVQVEFTGGELMPSTDSSSADCKQWQEIFNSDRSLSKISLLERFKFWLIQTMFGIGKVSAIDPATGKQSFTINKSPKGKLKLLYLDEELRITRGNRETILVCKREV